MSFQCLEKESSKSSKPWETVRLGDVAKTSSGGTPKRGVAAYYGGEIPWVKSGELGDSTVYETQEKISKAGLDNSSAKLFPKGTLCVALYGATVGKLGILGMDAATNQAVCGIFLPEDIDTRFAYRFLESKRRDLIEMGKGGAQSNISQEIIRDLQFPFPPPDEQRRIVSEIEKQFTRLEAGVSALKRVQANLKRYRAAVLKAACEGKLVPTEAELAKTGKRKAKFETGEELLARILTERRKNWSGRGKYKEPSAADTTSLALLPDGWTWSALAQLATHITDGTHKTPTYVDAGVPFLSAKDISGFRLSFDSCRYIPQSEHEELSKRCLVRRGTVLITKSGTIGRVAVVETDDKFSLFESVASVPVLPPIEPKFVSIAAFNCISGAFGAANQKGVAVRHLHLEDLRRVPIPLPPLAEQTRIVAEVERRLSVVEELEAVVSANLQRATRLRQSILQKAFSGNQV